MTPVLDNFASVTLSSTILAVVTELAASLTLVTALFPSLDSTIFKSAILAALIVRSAI